MLKGGAWYLVAQRSAGMRVYRVSRVASVRALDEECERPNGFELGTFWEEWSRSFEDSLPRVEVKVRAGDGERTLVFESLAEAHRAMLRDGGRFEVLEPAELRARVADTVRELAAIYVR